MWKILGCADASCISLPAGRTGNGGGGISGYGSARDRSRQQRDQRIYESMRKTGYICRWNSAEDFALAIGKNEKSDSGSKTEDENFQQKFGRKI